MRELTMADVLNQSWGGPEFSSYEVRMEDEQPMDADARTEAALSAFSGDEGGDNYDQNRNADQNQNAGTQGGQSGDQNQNADQNQNQNQDGQFTDEQLEANPRFQELSTFRDDVVNALSDFPGLVDDKGAPNLQEASAQLRDASVLYDIMQGKGTPSQLLDVMAKNGGWSDGQKQLIAQDLIAWLTANKFLKDGQAQGGNKQGGNFKDPIQERLDKIENDRKTERQQAEQQKVIAHQKEVFDTKFLPEVKRLCKEKGVPQEDVNDYVMSIAAQVKGNKAVIARIEKGNFVDLNKIFTQRYSSEVKRLERWTKSQTKAADAKSKNPKIPAGGAPPQPAGSAKTVNVRDRDSRIAAAADML